MPIRIAINGFGRIGRLVTRIAKLRREFDIVAVNDLGDPESLATVFKYDSVHGLYPGSVEFDGSKITIDGDEISFLQEKDPAKLPWLAMSVDYVIEASGVFRKRTDIEKHIYAGAKRVILTVPSKDPVDATIVLGVNTHELKREHKLVSNASCTTNCAAPVVKVLHENFGLTKGMLNTVHAYTNDQHLLDGAHKSDPRRARMAALSIIPTETGAGQAIGKVLPELAGKFSGMAMRVPVPDGSIIDLTFVSQRPMSTESINAVFVAAAALDVWRGILTVTSDPIVSVDVVGNPHSAIVDLGMTQCLDAHMAKVYAWYDNEWGYSNRVVDLAERMAAQDGIEVKFSPRGTGHIRQYEP